MTILPYFCYDKVMSKLEKVLFYLFLFLIPSNLAKHWVQNWSYVNGILVDYLIPTLYMTDIIIILILIFWLVKLVRINNSELSLPAEALAKMGERLIDSFCRPNRQQNLSKYYLI